MLNLDEFDEKYFRSLSPKMAFEYYGIFLKKELKKENPKFPIIKEHIFLQRIPSPIQMSFDFDESNDK